MKTIAFVSVKGGVGKTTLCANTAVCAAQENHPIAMMDFDAQQSLKDWWESREAEDIEFVEQPSSNSRRCDIWYSLSSYLISLHRHPWHTG